MAERTSPGTAIVNARELRRYSRHLLIPEVGLAGQERLRASRALVSQAAKAGLLVRQRCNALSSHAGVGRIGIVDDDVVDETNLQRQTIFSSADVGRKKAAVAAEQLHAINPLVKAHAIHLPFDSSNARELVRYLQSHARLHRSLSNPFPHQRCVLFRNAARRLRIDLSFRRAGERLSLARALLSLSLSGGAAARRASDLRRGRGARRPRRHRRYVAGERSAQAAAWNRRNARRATDARRYAASARAGGALRARSQLRALRRGAGDCGDRTGNLRRRARGAVRRGDRCRGARRSPIRRGAARRARAARSSARIDRGSSTNSGIGARWTPARTR